MGKVEQFSRGGVLLGESTGYASEPGCDKVAISGRALFRIVGPDGEVKAQQWANTITDAGDLYYATRVIAGVSPATPADATKVTGMKLGTGTTASAKNGAGAALVTYLSGSNATFDASFPIATNLGAGLGVEAVYKCTWAAGVATSSSIWEAVLVIDAGTDATSTAGNTIARVKFGAVFNKGAGDALEGLFKHLVKG